MNKLLKRILKRLKRRPVLEYQLMKRKGRTWELIDKFWAPSPPYPEDLCLASGRYHIRRVYEDGTFNIAWKHTQPREAGEEDEEASKRPVDIDEALKGFRKLAEAMKSLRESSAALNLTTVGSTRIGYGREKSTGNKPASGSA